MKLNELAYVLGDDGGLQGRIVKALDNLRKHQKSHKNPTVRDLCGVAIKKLDFHQQHPVSLIDDPHTFLRVISHFDGDLDENKMKSAVDTLGSYAQSDSD